MGVFDPIVELKAEFSGVSLSAGEEITSDVYENSPNEVLEVFRIEIIPPVDTTTGTIKKLREVGLLINGEKYPYIHANSVMLPAEHPNNPSVAVDLGIPLLHRRITGYTPSPLENTTVKLKEGDTLGVYAVADESITQDFAVVIKAARARGDEVLVREAGAVYDASFVLDNDVYSKEPIPITPDRFNELPGGFGQSKPAIYPWVTYARNKQATTPNTWYSFDYPNFVDKEWQDLSFNLVNKTRAYIVRYLGVLANDNSKATRIYVEGRETNPEYETRPFPEENFFYPALTYDVELNNGLKFAGPKKLIPERLIHGVKASIQHIDNGTSIPANGVEVHIYGAVCILR